MVDSGSNTFKAGFADDDAFEAVFLSIVSRPNMSGIMMAMDQKGSYVETRPGASAVC